jgi:hypothetical protein
MSRATKPRANRETGGKKEETKSVSWSALSLALFGVVTAAAGAVGGALVQDYFDVLKTNRELAIEYSQAASGSGQEVENVVKQMMLALTNASATVPEQTKTSLRDALLNLHRDTERLTLQTGVSDELFQSYAKAMADLADKADTTVGPADADPLIEALDEFYMSKRQFEAAIAVSYRLPTI